MIATYGEWAELMVEEHGASSIAAWEQRARQAIREARSVAVARIGAGDAPHTASFGAIVHALALLLPADGMADVCAMLDDVRTVATESGRWEFVTNTARGGRGD